METKCTYTYIFDREKGRNADKIEKPIHFEVRWDRTTRVLINTKLKCEPRFWDERRRMISSKHPNAIPMNAYLDELRNRLTAQEYEYRRAGRAFTPEVVNALVKGRKDEEGTALDALRAKAVKASARLNVLTSNCYGSALARLADFLKRTKRERMPLSQFTTKVIEDWDKDMRASVKATSANTYHAKISALFRSLVEDGALKSSPYDKFHKPKPHVQPRRSLTEGELQFFETIDRSTMNERQQQIMDQFLFSCYTGLRASDSLDLSPRDIRRTADGLTLDRITIKGRGAHVVIPLDIIFGGKAARIVERYNLQDDTQPVFNLYRPKNPTTFCTAVSKLFKVLGVAEGITFHTARHTCASRLAEATGNVMLIKSVLGHSSIDTSMIYIHTSAAAMAERLKGVDWG